MNKIISKRIFKKNKILTPKYFTLNNIEFKKDNLKKLIKDIKINYPIVIKPSNEGSSLGVKICNNISSLFKYAKYIHKKYNQIIFEEFIGGQEIQVAVINNKSVGAIELVPKRTFYDYKAKYSKAAKTKHIMPARLKKNKYSEVLKIAKLAHKALECKGVSRSDFKFFKNKFYLLEINTQPGMTNLSLVPEIAKYHGINFPNLVEKILQDAGNNK